jgi:hypothetical protein
MENDLYQIIYASAATRLIEEDELLVMLKRAREKNKQRGITGMLVHCEASFIQALEGPKDEVMNMLSIIRQDSRHNRIAVLFQGPIKNRSFSQWSMGFNRPSKEKLVMIEGYTPYLDVGDDSQAIRNYSSVALKLIGAFRELSDKKSSFMEN